MTLTTMRGMPQLYSGDEIAMRGAEDPDNRRDFPGGFAGRANAFTAAGRSPEQEEMFAWVKSLLKLRASRTELLSGEEQIVKATGGVMAFVRGSELSDGCSAERQRVLVVINNGFKPQKIEIPTENTGLEGCRGTELLWGKAAEVTLNSGKLRVEVGARQTLVVAVR